MRDHRLKKHRQKGGTLMVVLVLLVGISLISASSVNTSIMELRMARNVESSANTYQTALAAVDYVIADPTNLPMIGPLDVPVAVTLSGTPFTAATGEFVTASATRIDECAPPPRMRRATSLLGYSAFEYDVTASIDKNVSGMGQSGIVQGYLLMGPKC